MPKITLKACRINKELTVEQACELIGVSPATLANWEAGRTAPKVKDIDRIIEVYEVPYDNIAFK